MNLEFNTEDVHVRELFPLLSPDEVKQQQPASRNGLLTTMAGRQAIQNILANPERDERLLAIIGPCSIHDPEAALEYASW